MVVLLVSFGGRVHLAPLREELVDRVEQLVYIKGFSDTGEVTLLKCLPGQGGADNDGGDVCEVCDGMQAVIEGDAVHARELVVQQEQARFQVMHHLERLEAIRHEQGLVRTLQEQRQHEHATHGLIVFHHENGFYVGLVLYRGVMSRVYHHASPHSSAITEMCH